MIFEDRVSKATEALRGACSQAFATVGGAKSKPGNLSRAKKELQKPKKGHGQHQRILCQTEPFEGTSALKQNSAKHTRKFIRKFSKMFVSHKFFGVPFSVPESPCKIAGKVLFRRIQEGQD